MTNVNGVNPVSSPKSIQQVDSVAPMQPKVGLDNVSDVVEISTASVLAAKIQDLPEVRTDVVQRVKAEIEAGNYETEERIDATVDRLMDELFGEM